MPESPIDRESPEWPFEQVTQRLTALVESLPVGAMVPSERVLSDRYGVARGTVRRALDGLVEHGLLTVRPGRGRFVARRQDEGGQHNAP